MDSFKKSIYCGKFQTYTKDRQNSTMKAYPVDTPSSFNSHELMANLFPSVPLPTSNPSFQNILKQVSDVTLFYPQIVIYICTYIKYSVYIQYIHCTYIFFYY